jgi:serine O-acetyltransferase
MLNMISPLHLQRVSRWLWLHHVRLIPGLLMRLNYFLTGCELPPQVVIGRRVHFQHYGAGVIMHCNVEIGDDVWINPHVVLGQNIRADGPMCAENIRIRVGNRVVLGAGAKIIASEELTIGDDVAVGANAVVLHSVPPRSLAVGVPARIIPVTSGRNAAPIPDTGNAGIPLPD